MGKGFFGFGKKKPANTKQSNKQQTKTKAASEEGSKPGDGFLDELRKKYVEQAKKDPWTNVPR